MLFIVLFAYILLLPTGTTGGFFDSISDPDLLDCSFAGYGLGYYNYSQRTCHVICYDKGLWLHKKQVVCAIISGTGSSCDDCDPNACEPPQMCYAGMVKDYCNCCTVCGRREGERCDHEDLNFLGHGQCGDNLVCHVRNDLDWNDPPEAICVCISQNALCGSDGVTYENICQLTEHRYRRRDGLRAVSNEPCLTIPMIISSPENVINKTGSSVVMTCEAVGWPVPSIQWLYDRDGSFEELPGNNPRITVQHWRKQGGDEIISWLQFTGLTKEDMGTYLCHAENEVGAETVEAYVTVTS